MTSRFSFDDQDVSWLLQMRASGDLSRETVWEEAKRRGLLGPKFEADAEVARIESEPPTFAEEGGS
jgi:hypothetical protein